MTYESTLSPGTRIVILLCSGILKSATDDSPLTSTEFSWVLEAVQSQDKSVTDLFNDKGLVDTLAFRKITPDRIRRLMNRGGQMAVALEKLTNSGLWVISRMDNNYPQKLNERLKHLAPPLLYGAGDARLLSDGGLGIVGSRDVDEAGVEFTRITASRCASEGITVISGGARGVDQVAMQSASADGGRIAGILAADLMRTVTHRENRDGIVSGRIVLASPYNPDAGFSVGNAMGRNKYIYTLCDWVLVVSSDAKKGGTWQGATENLKADFNVPLFVRTGDDTPVGNRELIGMGGIPLSIEDIHSRNPLETVFKDKLTDNSSTESDLDKKTCKSIPARQLNMFD